MTFKTDKHIMSGVWLVLALISFVAAMFGEDTKEFGMGALIMSRLEMLAEES